VTSRLYVTDSSVDKVKVFNLDASYVTDFGSSGNGDGQFDVPLDVETDSSGNIYVADRYRINKFDSSYNFVGWIGRKLSDGNTTTGWTTGDSPQSGSADGAINNETYYGGIKVYEANDELYVTDYFNNRVQVFTLSTGAYKTKFSSTYPRYVDVDSSGNIYVTRTNYFTIYKSSFTTIA